MAEPDYPHSWGPVSSRPGVQGVDMTAPLLSPHALPFPQPFQPLSYEAPYGSIGNPLMSPFPGLSNGLFNNQGHGRSPYAVDGGHQMYPPTPPLMYPYVPAPRPPPAFRNGSMNQLPDMSGQHEASEWYARAENPMLHTPQPFFPPYRPSYEGPISSPSGPTPLARRQQYTMMGMNPPPRYLGQEAARGGYGGVPDQPRQMQSHNRRASYQDPYQHNNRIHDNHERRSSNLLAAQNRRSDRSVSPRTSNRRSFDRYSIDLSQVSTSSDAEEAVARAPPSNRIGMRHRARERPRFHGHHHHGHHHHQHQHQHFDPNIATPRQIQELKDKLPRRLPSELPDETSKTCDICQKDYSVTHVQPAEEEEVAVELPCGHVFGQFCIFQWFDTCKTHKNKVTCPMCRKLLIEPSRYHPALLSAISRGSPAFQELLANELRNDLGYM